MLDSHPVGCRLVTSGERVWGTEAPASHLCPVSGSPGGRSPQFSFHRDFRGQWSPRLPGVAPGLSAWAQISPSSGRSAALRGHGRTPAGLPGMGMSSEDLHLLPTLGCLEASGAAVTAGGGGCLARPRGWCWACCGRAWAGLPLGPPPCCGPWWSDSLVCSDRPLTGCGAWNKVCPHPAPISLKDGARGCFLGVWEGEPRCSPPDTSHRHTAHHTHNT